MMHRAIARGLVVVMALGAMPPLGWAKTPVVDSASTSTGSTVTEQQLQNLPLNGRSFADLVTLAPGIADHKASPRDSVNWSSPQMPRLPQAQTGPSPETVERIEVAKGSGSAAYGTNALAGVINFITRQPEWPGESVGANGLVVATGKSNGKEKTALIYGSDGVPIASFTANQIKKQPDQAIGALNYGCMLTSGKSQIYREDRLTSGKNELFYEEDWLTSGKNQIRREDRVRGTASSGGVVTPSNGPRIDYTPKDYKLSSSLRYDLGAGYQQDGGFAHYPLRGLRLRDSGGMTQIDPPMTPPQNGPQQAASAPKKDTGTVTDADVDRGVGKLNQAQRDALDQYGLTPKKPDTTPPQRSGMGTPSEAPTQSILDDLNPATLPLQNHPAATGEPTITENQDGSSTRRWPDGITETTRPDGSQQATYSDGSAFARATDGTMVDTLSDGTRVTRDSTGKETGRQPGQPKPQPPAQPTQPSQPSQTQSSSGSGAVTDQAIRDATQKQQPAIRDAINQYLTPQDQARPEPQKSSGSQKKSRASKKVRAARKPVEEPPRRTASASTTDADGNTVAIERYSDGTVTRTVTDSQGTVRERAPVQPEPPTQGPPRQPGTSASMRNPDGSTTTISKNPDGTTTRTVTDADGHVTSSGPVTPEPPTKVPPRQPGTTSASTTDGNGNTTTITKQPDGTTTRTVTDASGKTTEQGPVTPEPPTKVPPRQPGRTSASATDANGNTVTIEKQPDGTTTRTVTDPSGNVIEQGPLPKPEPTTVPPRTPGATSASATDEHGNTTTIQRNPDGTMTRTVTDASGKVTEQGPLTPPPATKPTPRDPGAPFASATDENGNTITLQKQPDGTTTQTITNSSGQIISNGPLSPPPVTKAAPRQPGRTWASTTDADGNTLTVEKQANGSVVRSVTAPDGTVLERTPNAPTPTAATGSPTATTTTPAPQLTSTAPSAGARVGQPPAAPGDTSKQPSGGASPWALTPSLKLPYNTFGFDYAPKTGAGTSSSDFDEEEEPFTPFMESGVIIGDTVYSNLGTYKVGEHPILDRKKKKQQATGPTGWSTGSSSWPAGTPAQLLFPDWRYPLAPPRRLDLNTGGLAYPQARPIFSQPRGWMPENVMVLPYGCSAKDKPARLNDIGLMFSGTLPTGQGIYLTERIIGLHVERKNAPAELAVAPNDPLYFHPGPGKTKEGAPQASDQWGLQAVGFTPQAQADSAWNAVDANQPNVIVAVIDSGLDLAHPDGPASLWTNPGEVADNATDDDHDGYVDDVHGWNFLEENHDLTDVKGHGTLVAGIIAAKRNNGAGIAGINPGARIMVLKVADQYGKTNSLNVYRALHYAADHGAQVINLSLGGEGLSRLDQLAVNYAHAHGAVVVVAAGNESGDVSQQSLPSLRRALTVAMLKMDGTRSGLSNQGVNVALIAPGEQIYSLHSKDAEWTGSPTARERLYLPATGTSFAAPIVAGTASLILAKYPGLPNVLVEDRLINSAKRFAAESWEPGTGWGLLNASQALTMPLEEAVTVLPTEVVVHGEKNSVASVELFGIVRGVFTSYQVELGKGRDPKEWRPLGAAETEPVNYGLLCHIDGDQLRGGKEWTVRITATSAHGQPTVARVPIAI